MTLTCTQRAHTPPGNRAQHSRAPDKNRYDKSRTLSTDSSNNAMSEYARSLLICVPHQKNLFIIKLIMAVNFLS